MLRLVACTALLFSTAHAEVTAASALARGTVLREDHLAGGLPKERRALVGNALRRPLAPGRSITPRDVERPKAVARQSAVTVLFRRGTLSLKMEGRALAAGHVGEVVDVSLPGRRRPVAGLITGPGLVEVGA